ncbi:MFS transporter [Rhodococcus sp. NM-2]|jgi:AAHS family benzoate transporter-like MFS transporter|uniref:MFS transporter n=1 Tax=Rhodococcus TaxID=1827 RepID=UPI0024767C8F|nr:MFS transporter [Rhodococcus opacus]MDH6287265.1 AAHS family benzoate transporter-like MFS transporter [Rhodococcus opacus]
MNNRLSFPAYVGVAVLAFLAIAADGYDLAIFGAATPQLLHYADWDLTTAQVGVIASAAIMGMGIGSIAAGVLADRFGVRRLFLLCVTWFSVGMMLCAAAPTAELLGIARFVAGFGLGGVVPTAVALTMSVAPAHRKNFLNGMILAGLPLGGVIAALTALAFLDVLSWRGVFFIGGAFPLLTVVPIVAVKLGRWVPTPVSVQSGVETRRTVRDLFARLGRSGWRALAVFTAVTFCGQIQWYGLLTWLPQIMKASGYSLGSALVFLVIFSIGAATGASGGSWIADRVGERRAAITGFAVGAVAVITLAVHMPAPVLYVFLFLAGAGTGGTQPIVFGFVASYFPADIRASVIGFVAGVGRIGGVCGPILGGLIAGRPSIVMFSVLSGIGIFAALLCCLALSANKAEKDHTIAAASTPAEV